MTDSLLAFDDPVPSPAERRAAGKARRADVARSAHALWEASPDRPDPVDVLEESNRTRMPDLVPLRYERMAVSPFAFLRGSAQVMAHDLASGPSTDLDVRLCGDAHLSNFGVFASPERRLVFDLNDFDEAAPGPFEWDVKRLAASIEVAGRENGFDPVARRRAVLEAVAAYRDWMERYAQMTHLEVWYARIEVRDIVDSLTGANRRAASQAIRKAEGKNHMKALGKLTDLVDGRRRILDDPPIVVHVDDAVPDLRERLEHLLREYRETLSADRRALFDNYRFVDFARKVVGVGSVGTRCWVALFQGPNGGPLFLQLKEARASVIDNARGIVREGHAGQRVVDGQRMLQASSDILLGWGSDPVTGIHYFARQMWDSKFSIDVARMGVFGFGLYAGHCGWALARAHARTGDSNAIHGYIGSSERFGESVADWAHSYADQTERDHAALVDALSSGRLPSA